MDMKQLISETLKSNNNDLKATYDSLTERYPEINIMPTEIFDVFYANTKGIECDTRINKTSSIKRSIVIEDKNDKSSYDKINKSNQTREKDKEEESKTKPKDKKKIEVKEIEYNTETNTSLNYEVIGYSILVKGSSADQLIKEYGNPLRIIPALQHIYSETHNEGNRDIIKQITLELLYKD